MNVGDVLIQKNKLRAYVGIWVYEGDLKSPAERRKGSSPFKPNLQIMGRCWNQGIQDGLKNHWSKGRESSILSLPN